MIKVKPINPVLATDLIAELDEYQSTLYPPESNHLDSVETLQQDHVFFYGGYVAEVLAATGAVKVFAGYGEIKRVYVSPSFRGLGLAKLIMTALEEKLQSLSVPIVRLETGPKSLEAVALYEKLGYQKTSPYGDYHEDPLSIFMEK